MLQVEITYPELHHQQTKWITFSEFLFSSLGKIRTHTDKKLAMK